MQDHQAQRVREEVGGDGGEQVGGEVHLHLDEDKIGNKNHDHDHDHRAPRQD